jgi:hypothetical protein
LRRTVTTKQENTETRVGAVAFPAPLLTLEDDRTRIVRIIDRLDVAEELAERADLASELVRAASRYEYVMEDAVLPALEGRIDAVTVERLDAQRDAVRESMDYIHRRTQHLAARNAHADDPQGLEDVITDVATKLRVLMADEDASVTPAALALDAAAQDDLKVAVDKSSRHAAERPKPARTAIGRFASNIATKIDHAVEDVATPDHAGADTIDG